MSVSVHLESDADASRIIATMLRRLLIFSLAQVAAVARLLYSPAAGELRIHLVAALSVDRSDIFLAWKSHSLVSSAASVSTVACR